MGEFRPDPSTMQRARQKEFRENINERICSLEKKQKDFGILYQNLLKKIDNLENQLKELIEKYQ